MKESVRYNLRQEARAYSDAKNGKDSKAYRGAVESIEKLARIHKEVLLRELSSLAGKIPNITLGDRVKWMSDKKVKGIVLNKNEPESRIGGDYGNSIVLVLGEGIVRVPWNLSCPHSCPNWEKRSEVSAQDYIRYTPTALRELVQVKKQGENYFTPDLVDIL